MKIKGYFVKRTLIGSNTRLIIIGAVLCFISFFMVWAHMNSNSFSIGWVRKGAVTLYQDNYGQTIGKQDGTYLSPNSKVNSSRVNVHGGDMIGGSIAYLIILSYIVSYFYLINIKEFKYKKYIPFISYTWLVFILLQGIIRSGISIGIIFYTAGLILIYKGTKDMDIWCPTIVSNFRRK